MDRPLWRHEVEAPRISGQSAHEGGMVFSPKQWPPLPQEMSLVLISVRDCAGSRAIVRPEEGLSQ
jgi:hypothetical protein